MTGKSHNRVGTLDGIKRPRKNRAGLNPGRLGRRGNWEGGIRGASSSVIIGGSRKRWGKGAKGGSYYAVNNNIEAVEK